MLPILSSVMIVCLSKPAFGKLLFFTEAINLQLELIALIFQFLEAVDVVGQESH